MANLTFTNLEKKMVLFVPNQIDDLFEYFELNEEATLVISFYDLYLRHTEFSSFNCLNNFKTRHLLLTGSNKKNYDFSELLKSNYLISLDNRGIDLEYDFLNFPNLEILRYTWNKNCKNTSSLKNIKELSLWAYKPKSLDLTEFSSVNSITEIRFVQSNIKSINGIEKLSNLKEIALISNRNLSFEDFNHIMPNVESLYIESCKNIDDSFVKIFPNLKKLEFVENGSIDSLKNILYNLKNLEHLNVFGTNISEVDNKYWKDFDNLKINFTDKKHHILKRKDFNL